MLMVVAGLIGGLGLVCMASRKTLLGTLIGVHLLVTGAAMMFVLAGIKASEGGFSIDAAQRTNGHVGGLFIVLAGLAQLSSGFALLVRLFYLKGRAEMNELKSLKH
jgi:NADH:ubiquinone oxidoreductase subunit K